MAPPSQEFLAPALFRCYHCGVESSDCSFKYFDNRKPDQPRYKCHHCQKLFTLGVHGRPQGKTYSKKRNVDPAQLQGLKRQCRHCGVTNNAIFKYYNNKNILQPRFKCLSCGKQFQMRLMGTGEERRLVPTSSQQQQKSAPRHRKQGVPEPFPGNIASSSSEDGSIYQPFDGSFMPLPSDSEMTLESAGATLLPQMMSDDDDAQYSNSLEAMLTEEEAQEAAFTSWTGVTDNGSFTPVLSDPCWLPPEMIGEDYAVQDSQSLETELAEPRENEEANFTSLTIDGPDSEPPTWTDEDAQFLDMIEAGSWDEESNEALNNDDAFSSTGRADDALPKAWTHEDAELMGFTETAATDNTEALYADTPVLDNVTEMPYSMSYAEAAAECCRLMDLDMAAQKAMHADDSTLNFLAQN